MTEPKVAAAAAAAAAASKEKTPTRTFGIDLVRDPPQPSLHVQLISNPQSVIQDVRIALRGGRVANSVGGELYTRLAPEEAIQLAAYLVVMARMGGCAPADTLYAQYSKDAHTAGQRHLAQKYPGFVTPPATEKNGAE